MPLCRITHTFLDAANAPVQGVAVRFTPTGPPIPEIGLIVRGVTVLSNSSGVVSFDLIQGLRGMLTMTHLPLARDVTVPDRDTADLFDLVGNTPDPFEPIDQDFIDLPRSS